MFYEKYGKVVTFVISMLIGFLANLQEILLGTEMTVLASICLPLVVGAVVGFFCVIVYNVIYKKKDWYHVLCGVVGSLVGGCIAFLF